MVDKLVECANLVAERRACPRVLKIVQIPSPNPGSFDGHGAQRQPRQ